MRLRSMIALAGLTVGACALSGAAQAQSVFIEQIGANNVANVKQTGEGNGEGALGGRIRQASDASSASVNQYGEDNDFLIDQDGKGAHDASLEQSGAGNVASITQDGDAANTATVVQGGFSNRATVSQTSSIIGHTAFISQSGSENGASIGQEGARHSASITQKDTSPASRPTG